jgi:putative ABC transport system permease protein
MPGFFSKTLREGMAMGRDFLPEEGTLGNDHVVIITHRLWAERFHSDPNILGKQIPIEGQPYTVAGVRVAGSADRSSAAFDVPLVLSPGGHDPRVGNIFGRLKPGVTLAQAEAELSVIDQRLAATRGGDLPKNSWTVSVEPLKNDWLDKKLERNLWLLLDAVSFVLLIACVNVANLLLAKGTSRQREIAVRAAIGASRRQVFAQLLTESLTLAIMGGAIGVGLGWCLLKIVIAILPGLFAQESEAIIEMNLPVLCFAAGVTLVAGVLFGCIPAWRAGRLNLTETLNQGSRSLMGGRRGRTQALLVAAEFALAITLLAGAGMAIHSFWKLSSIDIGVRTDHLLISGLYTRTNEHPSSEQIDTEARQLLEKLRTLPGVENAALSTNLPLYGGGSFPFSIAGQPVSAANQPVADFESVTPSYFGTFGVHLVKGRFLNDNYVAGSAPVVVVSESFVQRYLPGVGPLTQRLLVPQIVANQKLGPPIERQIVGVFRDVRNGEHLTDNIRPEMFVSFWQNPRRNVGLAVRTALDPDLVAKSVRGAVIAAEPTRLLSRIDTMDHRVNDELMGDRFGMTLFGAFAALALLLAALGIYGVMAFAVAQRRHEIGLRMALGAQQHQVARLILVDGMKLSLTGIATGLAGVYGLGRLMRTTLYGIQTVDLKSFAAVAALLLAAAMIASYLPARRAAKVDPMVALRYE